MVWGGRLASWCTRFTLTLLWFINLFSLEPKLIKACCSCHSGTHQKQAHRSWTSSLRKCFQFVVWRVGACNSCPRCPPVVGAPPLACRILAGFTGARDWHVALCQSVVKCSTHRQACKCFQFGVRRVVDRGLSYFTVPWCVVLLQYIRCILGCHCYRLGRREEGMRTGNYSVVWTVSVQQHCKQLKHLPRQVGQWDSARHYFNFAARKRRPHAVKALDNAACHPSIM